MIKDGRLEYSNHKICKEILESAYGIIKFTYMDLQAEKIELVKRLLETNDTGIIKAIKSIFISAQSTLNDEWSDLPEEVILDVKQALHQIDLGEGISHTAVKESYKKWL